MTNKRNYKQDFDNQLAMFYPAFQRLSFSYLKFPLQVRFNILSQVFWEWISGARVALSGNKRPIILLFPRTVSTRRGPRERKFVIRKAFWSPLQAFKRLTAGTNRVGEKTRLKKGIFCSPFYFAPLLIWTPGILWFILLQTLLIFSVITVEPRNNEGKRDW